MLDDMRELAAAAAAYRRAATATGLPWPDGPAPPPEPPRDLIRELFDVDAIAEQLVWFQSQGWHGRRILPHGFVMPWPTDPDETLDDLAFAMATPFPWRRQMPLFRFNHMFFTFVLAETHKGEIWRYEISPDTWQTLRAAPSLASLLTEWTRGIAAGVISYAPAINALGVGDPFPALLLRAPGIDPAAYPVEVTDERWLETRQRDCGVDVDLLRDPDAHADQLDAVDAVRATLRR